MGLLLLSGLFSTISLARAGIRHFWSKGGRFAPGLKAAEAGAVVLLLSVCVSLSILAEPVMRYTAATARALHAPRPYIDAVLGARAKATMASPRTTEEAP
jgi:multicomponent K+:H+ antiporter subunit D